MASPFEIIARDARGELDPGVVYVRKHGKRGRFLHVDPGILQLIGRSATDVMNDPCVWDACVERGEKDTVQQAYSDPAGCDSPLSVTYSIWTQPENSPVRKLRISETFCSLSSTDHGRIRVGRLVDTSALEDAQRNLAAEKDRLELVMYGTRLGLWDWNMQTGETTFNERWAQIVGHTLSELEPTSIETWGRLANPDDLSGSDELIERHARGELPYYDIEARMRHKDGHWVWVHDRGLIVEWTPDGKPLRMTGTHEDITDRKHQEQFLLNDAETDPLTGLGNRRRLDREINERLACGLGFGLIFFDLDGFKAINDTFGHLAGDEVLRHVAAQLQQESRQTDCVIRYGGDEFVVITPDLDNVAVREVAERMRSAVATVRVRPGSPTIGVSAGLVVSAELPGDARTLDAVLALADQRLYAAKSAGGNTLF
jgi:diguanylate cyclase (GGDEF)-like protein/PAS domain S-box-containing protein